ncbi:endonuclease/exonuclease/phosphatase family protein [Amaricoccus macauensis]|uniref:endonuclease/exonuclease/phosphatase family protein n=1 Tax=Amaricoccus macauensis TaxID=57001 RepID=UPI003C7E5D52
MVGAAGLVTVGLMADTLNIWLLSFIYSFRIHIGVVGILCGIAAIIVYRRNYVAYLIVAVGIGSTVFAWYEARAFSPWPSFGASASTTPNMRVMSFNVLGDNRQGPRLVSIIRDIDPDVAVILEANALLLELPELSQTYPYRVGCGELDRGCDSLILSKYPLENRKALTLSRLSQKRLLMADLVYKGVPIRITSAHLTKPYYDDIQRSEIWEVIRHLNRYEGNLILTGDFNASLMQPSIRRIPEMLDLRTGPFEPASWPIKAGRWGIAIDHILTRPALEIIATHRIEENAGSNHYGLYADIHVPGVEAEADDGVAAATQ